MPPKYGKRDSNESEIVDALLEVGATVDKLNMQDAPDLMVGYQGQNFLIEVKTKTGKLRKGQITWHENWDGQVAVVRTVDEALEVIRVTI